VQTPAIIFGDHTKSFKFIDFPFCLGADGTKVLRPKTDTHEKYLYWYLQTVKIPDAGYSRHFKYLHRSDILLPPLDEQKRIAAILDAADALRAKRSQALSELNRLTEAIFNKMLGNPQSQNWTLYRLTDIVYFRTGTLYSHAAVHD
jgi:type I restriction enzyme S subunit